MKIMNVAFLVACMIASSGVTVMAQPVAKPVTGKPADKPQDKKKVDKKIDCDVVEVVATTTDKPGMDGDLVGLEKKLKKPPFSSWNTFKVLSRATKSLALLRAETITLNRGSITILLRDVSDAVKPRLGLTITVDDVDGKRVMDTKVNVDAGESFVVGRSLANNEGHVLAISCH
jgi:hypothetical protein